MLGSRQIVLPKTFLLRQRLASDNASPLFTARSNAKSFLRTDGDAHDVAPQAYLLIVQAVDGFVFPHAARRGQRGRVGIIGLGIDREEGPQQPKPAILCSNPALFRAKPALDWVKQVRESYAAARGDVFRDNARLHHLTFDMSGGRKQAQPAGGRPLDGGVRCRFHVG
jgi:hypothetical protein